MEGIVLLRTDSTVPAKIVAVMRDGNLLQIFPRQDVELVGSVVSQTNEHADQARVRRRFGLPDNLMFAIEGDIHEVTNVELPGGTGYRLHLNSLVATRRVGRDYVIVRYIASERGRDETAPADFRCYQVLADLFG